MDEELINKFSDILKEKNIDINTLLKDFHPNSTSSSNSNNNETKNESTEKKSDNNFSDFDINTILKMKKIFDSTNNSSNDSNLLLALKPYLRESRKEKVDQYAKLLKLAKAFQSFQNLGGDK